MDKEREATQEDLREILTTFWLRSLEDADVQFPERLKSSELLAKYILGEGKTNVRRRGPARPPTTEVMKLAAQMEKFPLNDLLKPYE